MFFSEGFPQFGAFDGFEDFEEDYYQQHKPSKQVDNEGLYKLLEVAKDATPSEIKKAFFKLARKKHPDKGGDAKEFGEINAAYDVLKNENMRAAYDKYGAEGLKEGRGKNGRGMRGSADGFEDFCSMFGFGGGGGGRRRSPQKQRKAEGLLCKLEVTLEEVYNGAMKKFKHERYRVCETCDGQGCDEFIDCQKCQGRGSITKTISIGHGFYQQVVQTCPKCEGQRRTMKNVCSACSGQKMNLKKTTLEVPVDKGIPDEHDYVMIGEAHEAPGVMAGDLYVRFMIQPHDVFERKGADLFIEKKIMLLEALTGFTFEITHLDGRVLKIATMPGEVIENGSIKMIRNQGMPFHKDEMGSGNLFVRFKV